MNAPSVSYSITVRLEVPAGGSGVGQLTMAVEQAGGAVTALDVTRSGHERLSIDVTCAARDTEHADQLVEVMRQVLGHHTIETTRAYYAGFETAAAFRHFDRTILRLGQEPTA